MHLLGVKVDNVSMPEALQKIQGFLEDGRQHYIVTINSEFVVKAQKDAEFMEILNKADLAVPDGIGVVWAARFLGESLKERVTGIGLVESLKFSRFAGSRGAGKVKSCRVFLLGGQGGVAEKIAEQWLEVAGFCEEVEGAEPFVRMGKCQPDILLVALGAPKQEKWIAQNLEKIPSVKIAIGVGGAFDFLAGRIRRAPKIFQRAGLEWLWRLAQESKRLPRIFNATIKFPYLVLRAKLF